MRSSIAGFAIAAASLVTVGLVPNHADAQMFRPWSRGTTSYYYPSGYSYYPGTGINLYAPERVTYFYPSSGAPSPGYTTYYYPSTAAYSNAPSPTTYSYPSTSGYYYPPAYSADYYPNTGGYYTGYPTYYYYAY